MRPAFIDEPGSTWLFLVTMAVWVVIELRQALNRRVGATNTDRGSLMILRLCYVAGALVAALAIKVRATAYPENALVFDFSVAVIWAGIGLRWWCFHALGRYFTFSVMTSADQRVITTGPYRWLRHPSYAALLLILGGIGLTYGNWLSVTALVLLPLVGLLNRIRIEEAALSMTLGGAYTTFASGRKRLIPFVW